MSVPILGAAVSRYECKTCNRRFETREPRTRVPMHPCAGRAGILTPMVLEGGSVKIETVERQDYVGKDVVTRDDNNRPIMAVVTTRDNGQDCTVFAPCASAGQE